jgi:ectoine hydroxylase-related dioxygenase (phytanoyl-CoA dioxygenase family)
VKDTVSEEDVTVVSGTESDTLRQRYARDGFCVTAPLFHPEAVAAALEAAELVAAGGTDTGMMPRLHEREAGEQPQRLVKIAEPHNASNAMRQLLCSPEPWRVIAEIVDARMLQIWAVDLFIKRPEPSTRANIGWHQDGPFAPYWLGNIFTVWLALADVSADSSPLRYVRGSHRLGPLGKADLFRTDLDPASTGFAVPDGFEWDEVAVTVPAGGIAMHHRDTLHASGPNLASSSRYSLAIRVRTDRCEIEGNPVQVSHLSDPDLAPVVYDQPGMVSGSAVR